MYMYIQVYESRCVQESIYVYVHTCIWVCMYICEYESICTYVFMSMFRNSLDYAW